MPSIISGDWLYSIILLFINALAHCPPMCIHMIEEKRRDKSSTFAAIVQKKKKAKKEPQKLHKNPFVRDVNSMPM